jgi:DNA mismatch repair protein MutS
VIARARSVLAQHERAEQREISAAEPETPALQRTLFTPLSQQVADRIRALNLNELTPMQALQLLAELQAEIAADGSAQR